MSRDGHEHDLLAELSAIAEGAEALVRWEHELGGTGFPRGSAPELTFEQAAPAPTPDVIEPERTAPKPRLEGPAPAPAPEAAPPATAAPAPAAATARQALDVLAAEAAGCQACGLHTGRTRSVFARGNPEAELVFVGEGPGYNEDQQGLPFVGKAGQLLDRMIKAMGYDRDEVYICNVVKCRPPENRTPTPVEARACEPFLTQQLDIVAPKAIVALGKCATENLGCMPEGGRRWRGQWREYAGIPVMPTYHPAFLLRSPQYKRAVWDDLQTVMRRLGR